MSNSSGQQSTFQQAPKFVAEEFGAGIKRGEGGSRPSFALKPQLNN